MKKILAFIDEVYSFQSSLFIYSLSFSIFLALAPTIIISVMLFGVAYMPVDMIASAIHSMIPTLQLSWLQEMINYFLFDRGNLFATITMLVISLWLASGSIYSFMMIAATQEKANVPKWSLRLYSFIVFVFVAFTIVATIFVSIQAPVAMRYFVPVILWISLYLLYRTITLRKRSYWYGVLGATVASIACILAVYILKWVVFDNYESYANLYGSLALLVVLILFIYIIAYIIYVGFILNHVFTSSYKQEENLPLRNGGYFRKCIKIHSEVTGWFLKKVSVEEHEEHEEHKKLETNASIEKREDDEDNHQEDGD